LLYYPPDLPKEQIANTAAAVSTAAGRFGAATGAIAAVPSPYAPAATTLTFGASVIGLSAGMIEQTERYPLYGPVFNEIGGVVKGLDWINQFKQPEKK
jgi:filamentous hemagglutinin